MARAIQDIAAEINCDWEKPYYGAVPYLDAMFSLNSISDMYYRDSAKDIVLYFLSNAGTWKGPVARRVKAELKALAGV